MPKVILDMEPHVQQKQVRTWALASLYHLARSHFDTTREKHFVPRDHNTKRANLSIDVCAKFVAAKAIFSNFAIGRARLSN